MNDSEVIGGVRIFVAPDHPKMKLAPGDYVTEQCRRETDEWLVRFFGVTNLIADGQVIGLPASNAVYVNPRTYRQLRALKSPAPA